MTIVGFVRHGVTDWNREGRNQGQKDVPMNEEGIRQARRLAERLSSEPWDRVFSSDLSRAAVTADIVARAMGKRVDRFDERLREKSHGRLDGTTEAERLSMWGERWRELDHEEEQHETIVRRSLSFLEEVCGEFPGKRLLVVSHGAWIRATLAELVPGLPMEPLHNTSLTVLRRHADRWEMLMMNCKKHLEEADRQAAQARA